MSSLTLQQLVDKWEAKFREVRADLEAKAAAGDVRAKYLLDVARGEPKAQRVDVPMGPPPKPWSDVEREPGEDAE